MRDDKKSKAALLRELSTFRKRVAQLEHSQETLQESEKKWRSLVDNIPDIVMIVDHDGTLQFINHTVPGITLEQALGKSVYDYLPPEHHNTVRKSIERVFQTGETDSYEVAGTGPGGTTSWYESRVGPIKHNGQIVAVTIITTDVTQRKKTKQMLRESQSWQRAILDSIPDMAWLKDKEGRYIAANKQLCKAFNIKLEDFIGKTDLDISPEDLAKRYRADDREVMKSGKRKWIEEPWGTKKGKRIWIETVKTPIYNDKGQVIGTSGIARDITERKLAEQALRESENKYRDLVEEMTDVIYTLDTAGNVTSVNKAGKTMFGREPQEVIGRSFTNWIPQEHLPDAMAAFKRILAGEKITAETVMVDKGGKPHNVEFTSTNIVKDGIVVGTRGIIRDITERKKAEEALRESEERFRTIFDNAADGTVLADVGNKKFYTANKAFCRMVGCNPEEIKNLGVKDVHPKEDLPYVMEQFEKQERRELTLAKDIPVKRRDGSVFYADINSLPITLGGKRYLMGVFRDVTEAKRRQEELNIYREKTARAEQLASLGTLSATLAHELTQPLTVIRLSVENLLAELETISCPQAAIEGLKDSLKEVSNITSIVDRFRSFARKSSGEVVREVDLKAIAERIVKLLNESARRAKVTLRLEGMDKLPRIYSNEKDLEQLFFALIDNAIQAADRTKNRRLVISGAAKDKHVELQFSDNCGGIAKENLNKVFEPFFTTRAAGEGTGLGLCIVQRIASRAGGNVRVESRYGQGSTFFVTLAINGGKMWQLKQQQ